MLGLTGGLHTGTVDVMETRGGALPPQPTLRQTASYFGVDIKTWITQGRLTADRIGPRLIRIDRDSVLKLGSPIGGTL